MKKNNILIQMLSIIVSGWMFVGCENATIQEAESSISVNHPTIELFVGDKISVVASPVTATFTWSSLDETVASVSNTGEVTGVGAGSGEIIVTSGTMRLSIPVTVVEKIPAESISVSPSVVGTNTDKSISLTTVVMPTNYNEKLNMKWSSENPSIATVSEFGVVTTIAEGITNIVLQTDGMNNVTASIPIIVNNSWFNPPHILSQAAQCVIQMRDFDYGGFEVAYWDNSTGRGSPDYRPEIPAGSIIPNIEGGATIGYVGNGEWYRYTVLVADEGDYQVDLEMANVDGKYHLEIDGIDPSPGKTYPGCNPSTGGWGSFQWISVQSPSFERPVIHLAEGFHQIKFYCDEATYNLKALSFTYKTQ